MAGVFALKRIVVAAVQPFEGGTGEDPVADLQPGAVQADWRGVFEGKSQCVGRHPEAPGAHGGGSVPVAAEIKLGASLVVQFCHVVPVGTGAVAQVAVVRLNLKERRSRARLGRPGG